MLSVLCSVRAACRYAGPSCVASLCLCPPGQTWRSALPAVHRPNASSSTPATLRSVARDGEGAGDALERDGRRHHRGQGAERRRRASRRRPSATLAVVAASSSIE